MPVRAILVYIVAVLALGVAGCGNGGDETPPSGATAEPAAATSACPDEPAPYGAAPDGFAYEPATEKARADAVQSLQLDEAGGPADMRLVRREGLTLGSLIGIPSTNAGAYADSIIARAEANDTKVTTDKGFKVITLASGSSIAVVVRGCRTVLITAPDPSAISYLAENILSGH